MKKSIAKFADKKIEKVQTIQIKGGMRKGRAKKRQVLPDP